MFPCFSFWVDSILKRELISNWKFSDCMHFFSAWARQAVIETITVMYKLKKDSGDAVCCRSGTIIQSIFLCPIRSQHWLKPFGNGPVRVCTQMFFHSRAWKLLFLVFSWPDWQPLGLWGCSTFGLNVKTQYIIIWKSVIWELCWVARTEVPIINTMLIFLKANNWLFPKHTQILQSELSFVPFTSGNWIHFSTQITSVRAVSLFS